ncbi:hypothetical protein ACFCV3_39790 [Kribbella sp. NPDC056345]|uniref:hypothetical protein n=1 Tax=Kribbella sp. NPDC056345 TaxID=3345789 RepID=UPI0035DE7FDE
MLALLGCIALAGCRGDEPRAEPTTYSTLGVSGDVLCGFLPKADTVAALGSPNLSTQGSLNGRRGGQPVSIAGCTVFADERSLPNLEVQVVGRGSDGGLIEWQLKSPKPQWTVLPAGGPTGFAEPAFESRLEGKKTGELRKGAVAKAIVGDWFVDIKLYRPGKGRNAVADSIMLLQQVVKALQLPSQPTQTYAPYTPSSSATSQPSSPTK